MMDSRSIFILLILVGIAFGQLTQLEKDYIKSRVLGTQSPATKLFGDSIASTKDAISILALLSIEVPDYPSICKELQYEVLKNISNDLIDIDAMLKCKFDFKAAAMKESDFEGLPLTSFYDKMQIAHKLNLKLNWKALFTQFEKYGVNKKISNQQGTRDFSLLSTAIGVELYALFYDKVSNSLQQDIKSDLKDILQVLLSNEQELSKDVILFIQEEVSAFKLNHHIIKALALVKPIHQISNYEERMIKMLNYFLRFKYEFHSLENINVLLQVLNQLKWIPIPLLSSTSYNYVDDKETALSFVNALGNDFTIANATVEYEVTLIQSKEPKETKKAKNDYDLDDEPEEPKSRSKPVRGSVTVTNQSKVSLPLKSFIKSPGEHSITLAITYEKDKMAQKISKVITSQSTIRIDHIKLAYEQTENKADEKETTIEFTKRSYRTIKITQDSIIRLKAKLNYGDEQYNRVEQLFLRLKHNELGKTFSSYSSKYNEKDGYYYIGFAMNDQMIMESYNGMYELSLVVSDPSMKNPIIWSFGKIEVTFRKPLDPSMIDLSHKNNQKPRMEPTFTPEPSLNKNFLISIVFSCVILGLCTLLTVFLHQSKVNILNFPKDKTQFLYSLLFLVLLMIVFYVMVLFWVKLNILQTLALFSLLTVPGMIIVYKAMNSIKIDI